VLARHRELMERRLVKARAAKMQSLARNASLREAVNELRREKVTILMLQSALRNDSATLTTECASSQAKIGALLSKVEELDAQTDGLFEESRIEVNALEAEFKKLLEDEKHEDGRAAALEMLAASAPATPAVTAAIVEKAARDPLAATHEMQATARRAAPAAKEPPAAAASAAAEAGSKVRPRGDARERPMSRQLAALIAAGKQPSAAELRATVRSARSGGGGGGGAAGSAAPDGGRGRAVGARGAGVARRRRPRWGAVCARRHRPRRPAGGRL